MIVYPVVVLTAVWFLCFPPRNSFPFCMLLSSHCPVCFRVLRSCETFAGLTRCRYWGFVASLPRPRDEHLKPICSNSQYAAFRFLTMSFCCVAALVVRSFPSDYPKPLVPVRVALFLGNIRAQTNLVAKSNHCILIIRYFVSRPLFYMYYTISLV